MTKLADLFADLPLAEIVATTDEPLLAPPTNIATLARRALAHPTTPALPADIDTVAEWRSTQHFLAALATELLGRLHTIEPPPTPNDLAAGVPQFPRWLGCWWGQVLRFPYAARLAEAVVEAHDYLAGRDGDG